MVEIVLEIIKFTLPSVIVAIIVYYMLKTQARKEERLKLIDLKQKTRSEVLPLQLQAYERIALLLHRLSPESLIPRVLNPQHTVADLKKVLLQTIKQEMEHNITQQIYVGPTVWNAVQAYQMDFSKVVATVASNLDPKASAMELSTGILEYYINNQDVISANKVMEVLKADVKMYFK